MNLQKSSKKQLKRNPLIKAVAIAIVLISLLTSCTTTEKVDLTLEFPFFPEVYDADNRPVISYDEQNNLVSMPLDFWLSIIDYVLYVDEQRQIYDLWKNK